MSDQPTGAGDDALEISGDMLADDAPTAIPPPRRAYQPRPIVRADGRIDFERGMNHAPAFSIIMIVVCIGVFIWQLADGSLDSTEAIIAAGALHRESVMDGQAWRLLSATVLHGGFEHLIGNIGMLYILGLGCEHAFGSARMGLLYLFSALAGSLASLMMTEGPSIGASGAVFGVAGGLIVGLYRQRHRYFIRDKRISIVLLIWAVWTVAIGFLMPGIDNWAHIGGFVGGAMVGAVLPMKKINAPVSSVPV